MKSQWGRPWDYMQTGYVSDYMMLCFVWKLCIHRGNDVPVHVTSIPVNDVYIWLLYYIYILILYWKIFFMFDWSFLFNLIYVCMCPCAESVTYFFDGFLRYGTYSFYTGCTVTSWHVLVQRCPNVIDSWPALSWRWIVASCLLTPRSTSETRRLCWYFWYFVVHVFYLMLVIYIFINLTVISVSAEHWW